MTWLYIVSLLGITIGFINGAIGLKSMRSKEHPQAEISWKQMPLSPWRYETLTMVALAIHSLGLLCLTIILTISLVQNSTFTLFIRSAWRLFFSIFASLFASYMSGVILAFHLIQQWIRPVSYGASQGGMWYGGSLIGWDSYSHHEAGPENGFISLYSSYSPLLRTWVIQPPPETFVAVLSIVQQNLPSTPPAASSPWQRSPAALILGMTLLILAALVPAIWGWLNDQAWVWIYSLVAFFLVTALGGRWITIFDGRGRRQPQRQPSPQ